MAAITGSGVYTHADGLRQMYGTAQSRDAKGGSPAQKGATTFLTFELDFASLPLYTETQERFLDRIPTTVLRSGWLLRKATIITTTAFTGSGATLSIGTANNDGTTVDADGIDATIALTAIDAIGEEVACDGAQIGTKLASDQYLTVTVATASYTAGKATLLIEMVAPDAL